MLIKASRDFHESGRATAMSIKEIKDTLLQGKPMSHMLSGSQPMNEVNESGGSQQAIINLGPNGHGATGNDRPSFDASRNINTYMNDSMQHRA